MWGVCQAVGEKERGRVVGVRAAFALEMDGERERGGVRLGHVCVPVGRARERVVASPPHACSSVRAREREEREVGCGAWGGKKPFPGFFVMSPPVSLLTPHPHPPAFTHTHAHTHARTTRTHTPDATTTIHAHTRTHAPPPHISHSLIRPPPPLSRAQAQNSMPPSSSPSSSSSASSSVAHSPSSSSRSSPSSEEEPPDRSSPAAAASSSDSR